MVHRSEVEKHAKSVLRARRLRDRVSEISSREWLVVSARSGQTYRVVETPDSRMVCSCPAGDYSTPCRHLQSALLKTRWNPDRQAEIRLSDIRPGDRVLVSERDGCRWHTVLSVRGEMVFTEEVPEGFRMDFLVRHEPREAQRRVA